MRKLLTGMATVALSMSIAACTSEPAENADVAADANTELLVDENAATDANLTVEENVVLDANETANANNATE